MRTKDTKTWYVKRVGSDTHCNTKEDALDLYKYWASWFDDVALEEYNCTKGTSRYIRRKGDYFKKCV